MALLSRALESLSAMFTRKLLPRATKAKRASSLGLPAPRSRFPGECDATSTPSNSVVTSF
ncbi:uncharacterized protein G2W53_008090 [Senna tora]|uniref:Uncharacterized protein n=1 Tax=Senna tora TaxID=362788 RepID=A0A834X9F2_9FABA|nr:uncharacterized protein G2W53_008090 [Senna tora]